MAHFQPPPDGDFGEYDADSRMAVGSVWRMRVPPGGAGGEIALWGGEGLTVRSNNENVVKNPLAERSSGGQRIIRLKGVGMGTTMIEFGIPGPTAGSWAPGSPWPGSLQLQVTTAASVVVGEDKLVTLTAPHMALNALHTPVTYNMKFTRVIDGAMDAQTIVDLVKRAGGLKHLVISAHGAIVYDKAGGGILDSKIFIGRGFDKSNVDLLSQLTNLAGGVIWLGACGIGSDNELNSQRAKASRCYVVAPLMYMAPKPGSSRNIPLGKVDMFLRFTPKVWDPSGSLISFPQLVARGPNLGITV